MRKIIFAAGIAFVAGVVLGAVWMYLAVAAPAAREYAERDRLRAEQRSSLYRAFEHALADARAAGERTAILDYCQRNWCQ